MNHPEPASTKKPPQHSAPHPLPEKVGYWNDNLDAGNLGREQAFDFATERKFFLGPEGAYALSELGAIKGQRILDLGCGLGVASLILAQGGAHVVALDPAPRRIDQLHQHAATLGLSASVQPLLGSAEAIPLPDASVDAVFTKSVLIHTDLPTAIREIKRVLKPGGRAVFLEPLAHNPFVNLYRQLLAPAQWKGITQYFTEQRVATLRQAFPISRERRFFVFGFGAFVFQFALRQPLLFHTTVALTQLIDQPLLTLLPPTRRLAWFVVITGRTPT